MGWVLMECPNRDQDTEEKDVVGVLGNGWLVAWQLMHFFSEQMSCGRHFFILLYHKNMR